MAHVFCTKQAAPVIKSYSPELIVHPILDAGSFQDIKYWLERIHAVVIGPGLGRDTEVLKMTSDIITYCKEVKKPLVIDADGLFLITQNINLIKDYPLPGVILTPNKVEFDRLYNVIKATDSNSEIEIDYDKLGKNVLIMKKGNEDETFCFDRNTKWINGKGGSLRRCGGQGDLLSGSMATFFHWSLTKCGNDTMMPAAVASYAAGLLTRKCNEKGFDEKGRSMVCSDMIAKIHEAFEELTKDPSAKTPTEVCYANDSL